MASIAIHRNHLDVAEGQCQRNLTYSRQLPECQSSTTAICDALRLFVHLRRSQGAYSDALSFAEEAYNIVVEAYNPVHIEVQQAAGTLIHCLTRTGDLVTAERFAQQTYENLRDIKNGVDQESNEVAEGAYHLAEVILLQDGDLMKAEKLAREALHIRYQLYDNNHYSVGESISLLTNILQSQEKFGDETKELLERSLAISIRNEGIDG